MRLKQLLRVLLPLLALSALAVAATPQLTHVSVVAQGNTAVLTLRATGAFTHNEYRPVDNLLLIDLPGVSAGKLQDRDHTVQAPGVKAYRVVTYSGAAGVEVARVEVHLLGQVDIKVNEIKDALIVQIAAPADAAAPSASVPAAAPPASAPARAVEKRPAATLKPAVAGAAPPAVKPAVATTATPAAKPAVASTRAGFVLVQDVTVATAGYGLDIEIAASGPISGKAQAIDHPDRIVLDIFNSVPARARNIPVNSGEVRAVRLAQFQSDPPVTRLVVDLKSAQPYEVVQSGNKLTLKLHTPAAAPAPKPAAPDSKVTRPEAKPAPAEPKPAAAKASPVLADAKPAAPRLQPAAAPAPVLVAKADVAPAPKAAAPAANDFVVVQPKVQEVHSDKDPNTQPESARLMAANNGPVSTPAMASPLHQASQPVAAPAQAAQTPVNFAADQRQQQAQPPAPSRPKYTGEPISVNLKDVDLKDFFRLIHEISGLNIVLDPSVQGSLTLVLDDVPWDQALDIVLKNNGLDRQLEGNVLRIATVDNLRKEAEARRRQVEAQALAVDKVTATRFLSYAHAADVLPTLKKMLSARGDIVADTRTNALIIEDIPSVIPAVDSLIAQLDRKTQQVEIEARIIAAARNFARDIGVQLGAGFGNRATAVGGAAANSPLTAGYVNPPPYFTSPTVQSQPPQDPAKPTAPTVTSAAIPLFSNLANLTPTSGLSLLNLGANYRLDAVLTMAESRGLLKILSRPRILTQNNIQSIVKQGQRVPVVTQAQLGGPPTVTYIEAVLRLTVTPQITVENTIFLNVDIENTTPDFSNKIFGNPVFLTQQATTQVLVSNGGTVVIGGVIQSNNTVNIDQVPLLGSVPVLGNLFKHRAVKTNTQELIFFLTPRIVES